MAWIKSHSQLRDHPKIKRAARELNISAITMIGHMHALWWWSMEFVPDGLVSAYDNEDIAENAGWEGDPERFINALLNCGAKDCPGLLETTRDGGLMIHDWEEHCGKEYEKRIKGVERLRKYRTRKKEERILGEHSTNDVRDTDETNIEHCTSEVEKEKEKEIEKDIPTSPLIPPADEREEKILAVIRSIRRWPFELDVCLDAIRGYSEKFPKVDLLEQFRQMAQWFQCNPQQRYKNYFAFARNWLTKEAEKERDSQQAWTYSFTYEDLTALWDKYMPNVGFMPAPEPTRQWRQCLADRIAENPSARDSLDWWLDRFREIDDSDKASAREPVNDDGLLWRLELSGLLKSEEKLQKLMTGAYKCRQLEPQFIPVEEEGGAYGW